MKKYNGDESSEQPASEHGVSIAAKERWCSKDNSTQASLTQQKMQRNSTITTCLLAAIFTACASPSVPTQPLPSPTSNGLLLSRVAHEQSIDLSKPLSSDDLATIGVLTNPGLLALRASQGVANAQVFAAGLYPDPSISFALDRPLQSSGLVTALAASLGIDVAALASRGPAIAKAEAQADQVRLDIVWAEWNTGEQARLLAVRIFYLEQANAQAGALRNLAKRELDRVWSAVARGDVPAADMEARRIAATDAGAQSRALERDVITARLSLNRLLDLDPGERLNIAAPVEQVRVLPPSERLLEIAVGNRADFAGLRAAYEGAAASIAAASLSAYPLPTLSVNYARDTGNIGSLGPSIALTLPLWNRGRGLVAVARATREQQRIEYFARIETVRADIAAARQALDISSSQLKELRGEIEPRIAQVEAIERAANRGDLAAPVAAGARIALVATEIQATNLAQSVAELQIVLELTIGCLLREIK